MKIGVFTDIHYRPETADVSIDPDQRLAEGLEHVVKFNTDLDHIVISGDLTHEGDRESYERLKRRLDQTDANVTLMIGNHDHRETFLEVFDDTATDENGFVQYVIDTADYRLIFLDTLNGPPYKYPSSHIGHLCDKRLDWMTLQLETAGDRDCVIFMHHPPHDTGFVAMDAIKLGNGPAFYKVLEKYNNVRHIFCGHVHRTIFGSHRGIPFSVFKSTVGQMPMLFDLMDFHMECDEPAAYGLIKLGLHGMTVHTEDYGVTDLSQVREQSERKTPQ